MLWWMILYLTASFDVTWSGEELSSPGLREEACWETLVYSSNNEQPELGFQHDISH